MNKTALVLVPFLVACGRQSPPAAERHANADTAAPAKGASAAQPVGADARTSMRGVTGSNETDTVEAAPVRTPARKPIAVATTLTQWRKAENRATCAPLVLTDDAGAGGSPRAASMAGGWGVAFDLPGLRSAYGVAGVGVKIDDFDVWVKRIEKQWPYLRPIGARDGGLPGGAIAGYGLDGARAFTDDNPAGRGERLGAYVLIPRQGCLYNLWSQLGRSQMEAMIDNLEIVDTR